MSVKKSLNFSEPKRCILRAIIQKTLQLLFTHFLFAILRRFCSIKYRAQLNSVFRELWLIFLTFIQILGAEIQRHNYALS